MICGMPHSSALVCVHGRAPLETDRGIAVETVTEDAHTALKLHRKGYTTAYLRRVLAGGLATESPLDQSSSVFAWCAPVWHRYSGSTIPWRARIELLPATLLFQCDAAFLFGYPAIGVPHRAPWHTCIFNSISSTLRPLRSRCMPYRI